MSYSKTITVTNVPTQVFVIPLNAMRLLYIQEPTTGNKGGVIIFTGNNGIENMNSRGFLYFYRFIPTAFAFDTTREYYLDVDVNNNLLVSLNTGTSIPVIFSLGGGVTNGNMLKVDQIFGDDVSGSRQGSSFQTITKALTKAQAGDVVYVLPGSYNESITIPAGVAVEGISGSNTIIQQLNVTVNTDLVTMGENSRLEFVNLNLTSAQHVNLRGIVLPGTTAATSKLRTILLSIDNSSASSGGTSNVYGVHSTGTANPNNTIIPMDLTNIKVQSIGNGSKRGIYIDSNNTLNIRNSQISCTFPLGGTGSAIGVETNNGAAILNSKGSTFSGTTADISQTLGQIIIDTDELSNANGLGFSLTKSPSRILWGDSGTIALGTNFMRPGTAASTATEIKLGMTSKCIALGISIRAITAPGVGNSTIFTLRKNGVDTLMVATLSDANTVIVRRDVSVSYAEGDDISMKVVNSGSSTTSDVLVEVILY
jgi:hypothetical protein